MNTWDHVMITCGRVMITMGRAMNSWDCAMTTWGHVMKILGGSKSTLGHSMNIPGEVLKRRDSPKNCVSADDSYYINILHSNCGIQTIPAAIYFIQNRDLEISMVVPISSINH
jgi:hypothetical protein